MRTYITSTIPCLYDRYSLLDLLGIYTSELILILYNIHTENLLNFMRHSQTFLELLLSQHNLFRILTLSIELHNSFVLFDHSLKNLHLCSLVKSLIIESFPRSFSLLDHPLLNKVDLFCSGIDPRVHL